MSASKIPAAQDALKALLDIASPLSNVAVSLGYPPEPLRPSHVWVAGDVDVVEAPIATGFDPTYDERFTLTVWCMVVQSATYAKARDAALALSDAVRDVVRQNLTLSGSVSESTVSVVSIDEEIRPQQRAVLVKLAVACVAYT